MKNVLSYLFCFLMLLISSCQDTYSEETILEYFDLAESLRQSNDLIFRTNQALLYEVESTAKSRPYEALATKTRAFFEAGDTLIQAIEELKKQLVEHTGGYYSEKEALELQQPLLEKRPKGAKNSSIVEELFLSKQFRGKAQIPQAEVLDQKIQMVYDNYLTLLESCWEDGGIPYTIFMAENKKDSIFMHLKKNIDLRSSRDHSFKGPPTWAQVHFQNQPLAAVLLTLASIKNNLRTTENTFLSFLAAQTSYGALVYDKTLMFSNPLKRSIRLGETYESEIGLGTYASKAVLEIMINGETFNSVDGVVHYSVRPKTIGQQKYTAQVTITNPLTRERETFSRDFAFEVIP